MKYYLFSFLICFVILSSCKTKTLHKIKGENLEIHSDLSSDPEIEEFIKPYRDRINQSLDSVISYARETYSKKGGTYNTAIGNLMANAVFLESNPVFNARTGKDIDLVLLNHGGIRAIISKGPVTIRTAFEVMPFENSVVVVHMSGDKVLELVDYLVTAKKAHPIQNLKVILNTDGELKSATINGSQILASETYYVATSDYLFNGGDRMTFFKPNLGVENLNYKIRNVLIDHFSKQDTLAPVRDDRFIQLNN